MLTSGIDSIRDGAKLYTIPFIAMDEMVDQTTSDGRCIEVPKYTRREYYHGIRTDVSHSYRMLVKPLRVLEIEPWFYTAEYRSQKFLNHFRIDPRAPKSTVQGPAAIYQEFWECRLAAKKRAWSYLTAQNAYGTRDSDFVLKHYRNCRMLAVYDQALELLEQGLAEYRCAWDDRVFIDQGRYRCV